MNAILTLHKINLSFADKTIFKDLSLNIHNNSKICLIGKNGSGKTSLMNIITGELELDHGKRWLDPLIKISYLKQHIAATSPKNIYDFILSNIENKKHNTEYSYIIKKITTPFGLNLKSLIKELSGGELRKVALACALINEPDLLLLDEPTNHLDIEAIKWLEEYLKAFRGSYICISHDKRFLENISNQVFWLDRGNIKICPYGYKKFFEWSQKLLAQEKRELDNRQKNLNIEIDWSNRGVKARRKRDMRRLNEMKQKSELLKQDKNSYDNTIKKIALVKSKQNHSSKLQVEFIKVSKFFKKEKAKTTILQDFNLRIMCRDHIAIIGKNGSGKSSFLKLLIGELAVDNGKIKLAKNMNITYFSQNRDELDQNKTLSEIMCPNGGEYIKVANKNRHIYGYLKDFMFPNKIINHKVSSLSGGQQNRLILAKILANPGDLLILDEPTNDLDMDVIELLVDILNNYKGTLLIVSHDRDFLDKTTNKTLLFTANGNIESFMGSYSDYLKDSKVCKGDLADKKIEKHNNKAIIKNQPKKLSYKLKYELENLPQEIKKLELTIKAQEIALKQLELNNNYQDEYKDCAIKHAHNLAKLDKLETRFLELLEI